MVRQKCFIVAVCDSRMLFHSHNSPVSHILSNIASLRKKFSMRNLLSFLLACSFDVVISNYAKYIFSLSYDSWNFSSFSKHIKISFLFVTNNKWVQSVITNKESHLMSVGQEIDKAGQK